MPMGVLLHPLFLKWAAAAGSIRSTRHARTQRACMTVQSSTERPPAYKRSSAGEQSVPGDVTGLRPT